MGIRNFIRRQINRRTQRTHKVYAIRPDGTEYPLGGGEEGDVFTQHETEEWLRDLNSPRNPCPGRPPREHLRYYARKVQSMGGLEFFDDELEGEEDEGTGMVLSSFDF
jgi:hypothetical protein